jgi:hypothetical protein
VLCVLIMARGIELFVPGPVHRLAAMSLRMP